MREITAYETDDGEVFTNRDDAMRHEADTQFMMLLRESVNVHFGNYITEEDVCAYIETYAEFIHRITGQYSYVKP